MAVFEAGYLSSHEQWYLLKFAIGRDVITKAALSPQLFKDPDRWSGRGFNLRPPGRRSGALPTELTGQWSSSVEEIRSSVYIVNLISRVVCAEHTPSGP